MFKMQRTRKLVALSAVLVVCVVSLTPLTAARAEAGVPNAPQVLRVNTVNRSATTGDVVVVLRVDASRSAKIMRSDVLVGSRKCIVMRSGRTCVVKGVSFGSRAVVKARSIGQRGSSKWGKAVRYLVRPGNLWTKNSADKTTAQPITVAPTTTTPANTATTTTTATPSFLNFDAREFEAEVLRLTNQERAAAGLQVLVSCPRLADSALGHSQRMVKSQFFSHTDPETGKSSTDRIRDTGYLTLASGWSVGENIAMGQATAAALMDDWMTSPGHRANILKPEFTHLGVGVTLGVWQAWQGSFGNWNQVTFSTQNFGTGGTCQR